MLAALRANIAATIFGLLAALFAIIAVVQSVKLNGFLWIDGVTDKLEKCEAARVADRLAYADAQQKAHEANEAEVARIEADQEKINAESKSRYERDLARLRAGGLRKDLAAPPRDPRGPQAGTVPDTAQGSDAEKLCVPRSELMRAAEGELRLNALIDWINEQAGIRR